MRALVSLTMSELERRTWGDVGSEKTGIYEHQQRVRTLTYLEPSSSMMTRPTSRASAVLGEQEGLWYGGQTLIGDDVADCARDALMAARLARKVPGWSARAPESLAASPGHS
jgi:hypothetical protein